MVKLNPIFKYLALNKEGDVQLFECKPVKGCGSWLKSSGKEATVRPDLFDLECLPDVECWKDSLTEL